MKNEEKVSELRRRILSTAKLLQDVPTGTLPDAETLDLVESDLRAAIAALEELEDCMP